MGKLRRILAIFTSLLGLFFVGNAFAGGYSCPTYMKYTSCNAGYYMTYNGAYNGGDNVGNACTVCPDAATYCPGGKDAPIYQIAIHASGGTLGTTTLIYRSASAGFCSAADANCVSGGSSVITTVSGLPTRSNYTLNGLYSAISSGTQYLTSAGAFTSSASSTTTSTATWYAQWTPNTYTITLNDNNGTGGSGTVKEVYDTKWTNSGGTTIMTVAIPTRSGYVFTGYYDATTGGTRYITAAGALPSSTTKFTANTTLYAQWSSCSCTNDTGATGCSATVSNNTCNITWSCISGYYKATKSASNRGGGYTATCDSCTANAGSSYTASDGNRNTVNTCYRSCTTSDVANSNTVSGKFYYGATAPSSCVAATCKSTFYLSSGACTTCGSSYPYHDADANGQAYCYKNCAAQTGYTVTGRDYYSATDTCSSTPNKYEITLNDSTNGGTGGSGKIYTTYNTNVYLDSARSKTMTTGGNPVAIPTKSNAVFLGYYDTSTGTTQYIGANGYITSTGISTAKTSTGSTWYAKFSDCSCTKGTNVASCTVTGVTSNTCQYSYSCSSGYNNSGNTSGTFTGTAGSASATSPNCSANSFTVTFKSGNTTLGTQSFSYGSAKNLTAVSSLSNIPVAAANGWSFVGWSTGTDSTAEYTDAKSVSNLTATNGGNVVLYGVWSRPVTFKYYDGASATSVTTNTRTQYYYNSSTTAAGASAVSTYALATQSTYKWSPIGWALNSNTTTSASSTATTSTANVTPAANAAAVYTALYSRTATIAYNGNGNTGGSTSSTTSTQYYNAGSSAANALNMTLASNGFTKTNYEFINWAAGSASGTQYSAGGTLAFPNKTWASSNSYTMYAVWSLDAFTVNFNSNGATSGAPSVTQVTCSYGGNCATATQNTMLKTNSIFLGWNTDKNATTAKYLAGGSINDLGNTTLYAIWGAASCTPGTGVQSATLNTISGNAVVCNRTCKAGYYGAATVTGSAGVTSVTVNCTPAPDGSFVAGTGATDAVKCAQGSYSSASSAATSCTACPAGRTTSGTGTKYNANGNTACSQACSNNSQVTTWNSQTWSNNKVANLCSISTCSSGYVRTGSTGTTSSYACSGCNWTAGANSTIGSASTNSSNQCSYTVTCNTGYSQNGGSDTTPSFTATGTAGTTSGTLAGCSARYYSIALDNASATTNGTATLYTTYNTNVYIDTNRNNAMTTSANGITIPKRAYTVTYNANGGSVTPANATATYAFKGYYNTATGTAQYIDANGKITSTGQTAGKGYTSTATWYAQWTSAAVTLPTPSRDGYTFNGWNTKQDGSGTSYNAGSAYTPTATTTLFAQWSVDGYGILYELNGGTNYNGAPNSYTYGVGATISGTPTRTNATFGGWCTDAALQNCAASQTVSKTATGNQKFYAKWTCNTCTTGTGVASCSVADTNNVCVYTSNCANGYTDAGATCSGRGCSCVANTITLKWLNGGRGTAPSTPASCTYNSTFTAPGAMTATGYTFKNWSVNSKTFNAGATVNCNYDTLGKYSGTVETTGVWGANTLTFNFDANGATSGAPSKTQITCSYDSACAAATQNTMLKTNSVFLGWSADKNATSATYSAGGSIKNIISSGSTTLYAVWSTCTACATGTGATCSLSVVNNTCTYATECKPGYNTLVNGGKYNPSCSANTYTVTYSCGSGAGTAPSNATATYDSNFIPATNSCTRDGYDFAGWLISGTSTTVTNAFKWQYLENKTFTAQWSTGDNYTITYNEMGGTINAGKVTEYNVETATFALPTNVTRIGYTFAGWWSAANGGTQTTQITKGSTGDRVFYAHWTANCNAITLDNTTYGGTGGTTVLYKLSDSTKWYTDNKCEAAVTTLPSKPSKTNAGYSGHYTSAGTQYITAAGTLDTNWTVTGTATIYARYACNTNWTGSGTTITGACSGTVYTVTLRNYDDSATDSTIYEKYSTGWYSDASASTTLAAAKLPTRSGYTFRGYYTTKQSDLTASGGSGTRRITNASSGNLPGNTTFTESTKLYAAWARNCANVSNGSCELVISSTGTATYTTKCDTGYTLTSGSGTYNPSCSANTYTVAYNANGGSGTTASSSHTYNAERALTANGFTNDVKIFLGWNTDKDAKTATYTNKASVKNLTSTNGATVTLYAIWGADCTCTAGTGIASCSASAPLGVCGTATATAANGYNTPVCAASVNNNSACSATPNTITLKWLNGGRGTAPSTPASCTYNSTFTAPSAMTATGYTFKNWMVNSKTFNAGATVNCNYDTLGKYSGIVETTGVWGANTLTFNFDANGATSGAPSKTQITCSYDSACAAATQNTMLKTNSIFLGWSADKNATSATYSAGGSIKNIISSGSKTLYAVWSTCTACAAGTGATCSLSVVNNTCTYVTECKTGYNTLVNGGKYNPSCSANKYTVAYDANGGSGTTASSTHTYNAESNLTTNGFLNTGYTFKGWAETPTGNVKYSDGDAVTNLTAVNNATVKLYAVWGANAYSITLNNANATTNGTDVLYTVYATGVYLDAALETLMTPSANGITIPKRAYTVTYNTNGGSVTPASATATYAFKGYYNSATGTAQYIDANGKITSTGQTAGMGYSEPATWYAQWNDGSVTLPTPSRTGYKFNGWNTQKNGGGTSYNAGSAYIPTANTTLFAQWVANSYTIAYNWGGGIMGEYAPTNITYDADFIVSHPTRTGYTFAGWNISGMDDTEHFYDDETTTDATITKTMATDFMNLRASAGTVTFAAQWTANKYTVVYNLNGAKGDTPNATKCTYGTPCTLTDMATPTFYKGGKYLAGWSMSENANSAAYTTTATNLTSVDGDTVTLYAVWTNCLAGSYHPDAMGMAANLCAACSVGTYSANDGATTCIVASQGYYVDKQGASGQTACTANATTAGTGSTSITACVCNPGYSGNAGIVGGVCTACACGTYKNNADNTACIKTDDGYYVKDIGATSQTMADAGYYATAGACAQYQCGGGKWSNAGAAVCSLIEAGCFGSSATNSCPESCEVGYTSNAGSTYETECYMTCEEYDVVNGTAYPFNDIEYYPAYCTFYGISDSGNPCDIIDGVCVEKSCHPEFEMIDGACTPCNREHAVSYESTGNCIVKLCTLGYHPDGKQCEADIRTCSADKAVSATQVWNKDKKAFGECIITECKSGYHIESNVCLPDEKTCVIENGVGVRAWNEKTGAWGDCVATKCDPGYTLDRFETDQPVAGKCNRCYNMYMGGKERRVSSYVQGCEIAACMYEGQKYTLSNNECVLICDEYSDETGTRHWNPDTQRCENKCKDGYINW